MPPELFAFIGATQADAWEQLVKRYGGNVSMSHVKFADRLSSELDKRGVVDVLRHGVVDQGVTIRLASFRPAHGLTPELVARYEANRLTATRQLRYDAVSEKALDLALFVNGLPVATAELKNPLTGQGVEQAIRQYRADRDPRNRTLARAVVHFAVDPQRVAMTTRLSGSDTRFLPFNQEHAGGAGNPPNASGHATAYLWERVWRRDAWLDLLGRFVHVEKPARGSKKRSEVIFPRFHQWDAVLRLEAAARDEGAGRSYLVQHSAGSGKSNTIAWLAHRLSTLHAGDTKVFDKVVVITDRVVLDRQLQDTIYQFEHAHGVVERIDQSSQQLADALAGQQARIIITTLQKFPFLLDKAESLPSHRYAVIVDEAHSSQTGEAAKELRRVLGARAGDARDSTALPPDAVEEALAEAVAARGRQKNMSFFAFTATPKGKTLELFGRRNPTDRHEAFHMYSMRQAIQERFIHDVLASYTTYATFFHLEKAITDDPAYATVKARRAIARFMTLHEHNLAQKAEIVVESGEPFKPLETATLKTIAAFANSRAGGTLLIGVDDAGAVTGLSADYASLAKLGKDPRDLFMLHLTNVVVASVGEATAAGVSLRIHTVDGKDLCRVHVQPSSFPVDAVVTLDKKGQFQRRTAFYVRIANGTREIAAAEERQKYIAGRWGRAAADGPATI